MSINLLEFLQKNQGLLKKYVGRFIAILRDPRAFILSTAHNSQDEVFNALVFAALISFINFLLYTTIFINTRLNWMVLAQDTLLTYIFWILYAFCFHISAKLLRGQGSWYSSLSAFLNLLAFTPIIYFVSWPHELHKWQLVQANLQPATQGWFQRVLDDLLYAPMSIESISWLLGRIAYLYWLVCVMRVFHGIHKVGKLQAVIIGVIGFTAMSLIQISAQSYIFWWLWSNWNQ